MNEVSAALIEPRRAAMRRMAIADCDLHPTPNSMDDLRPYMDPHWWSHLQTFGARRRHGCLTGSAYPKGSPGANRRDADPPGGGKPGGNLAFMQSQHLDPNNVALGILNMISPHPGGVQNPGLSAALCSAANDWQVAEWTSRDPRLRASVMVPYEQPLEAAAEIDRRATDRNFAQILLLSRTADPLGQRRYWPIYEAAVRANLPIGVHAFGYGGEPLTSGGWPSFYIEEMIGHAACCQAVVTSMIVEGVFDNFPGLRVILVESGFSWVPAHAWRMDKNFRTIRAENPAVKRLPSEIMREKIWFTTQPMEEPQTPAHLLDIIEWIGWDRLMFATDYPHWDYDDPATCLPVALTEQQRAALFHDNAWRFFLNR